MGDKQSKLAGGVAAEEASDKEWAEPIFLNKTDARTRNQDEIDAIHPEIEQLHSLRTFKPLLFEGQLTPVVEIPEVRPQPVRQLYTDLRGHFTQLGLHAFNQQMKIFRELDRTENTCNGLIAPLLKRKHALMACGQQLETLPEVRKHLAKVLSSVERCVVACEALRVLLPVATASFEDCLKKYALRNAEKEASKSSHTLSTISAPAPASFVMSTSSITIEAQPTPPQTTKLAQKEKNSATCTTGVLI